MSTIHLHGYLGMKNLGDDLMLHAILTKIPFDGNVVCWMNKNTSDDEIFNWKSEYPRIEFKKYPFSFFIFPFLIFGRKIKKSVWVGGNCFYSHKGNVNLRWLLKLVKCYYNLNIPFIFLGVGIGNYDFEGARIIDRILNFSHKLYFRDNSYKEFSNLYNHKVVKCGDLAFLYHKNQIDDKTDKKGYIISGHKYFSENDNAINVIQESIDKLDDYCYSVDFHNGTNGDKSFNQKLTNVIYLPNLSLKETIDMLQNVKGVISFRLHSIILSDLLEVPNIAINYDSKITAYFSRIGRPTDTLISVGQSFNPKDVFEKWKFDEQKIISERDSCVKALNEVFNLI